MTTDKPVGTIEQNANSAYAVWTEDGPAIFPSLDDAREALAAGAVTPLDGDREWYDEREWPWYEIAE